MPKETDALTAMRVDAWLGERSRIERLSLRAAASCIVGLSLAAWAVTAGVALALF